MQSKSTGRDSSWHFLEAGSAVSKAELVIGKCMDRSIGIDIVDAGQFHTGFESIGSCVHIYSAPDACWNARGELKAGPTLAGSLNTEEGKAVSGAHMKDSFCRVMQEVDFIENDQA